MKRSGSQLGVQVDVLIAGGGVAGLLLARALRARSRRVLVANDPMRPAAAQAAVGLLNPVLGKRCTLAWQAAAALPCARATYAGITRAGGVELFRDLPLVRVLRDEAERAAWSQRAAAITAAGFVVEETTSLPRGLRTNASGGAIAIHGAGLVDAWSLLDVLRRQLVAIGAFVDQRCEPANLALASDHVAWPAGGVEAGALVVADGAADGGTYWVTQGRGHALPVRAVKGETVLVHAPRLAEDAVFIDGHFLAPRGDGRWVCGATQEPNATNAQPSAAARAEFEAFLRTHVDGTWSIEDHRTGLRPVTPDLRPIVGRFLPDAPVYIFNGLGSRGLALGPWLADALAAHLVEGAALPADIAPSRFAPVPADARRWHAVDVARTEALLRAQPGDRVIDLTVGNGGDILWLAEAVDSRGHVVGFDVQPAAIETARRRLDASEIEATVELVCADHARLAEFVRGGISVAVANLGHRPGSDSPVITRPETTLAASAAAMERLRDGGALVAVIYVGHDGGPEEYDAIQRWTVGLDNARWKVNWHLHPAHMRHAPAVLVVERI